MYGNAGSNGSNSAPRSKSRRLWTVLGIFAEILFTVAAICALYIIWQMWWTGVQSEHTQYNQRQSVSWSDPSKTASSSKGVNIAKAQDGTPPIQPQSANTGDMVAQIYIPRFGDQWQRNIVQGTDMNSLNQHGMGHYQESQMPGQIGNFAAAGHRNGYGQPLGDVDKLQVGDPIVLRTKDYWYVYTYTSYKIVTPDHVEVVAPNPENPNAPATERMITLTTCEPKYSTPTHRWISYGKFKYWAKVSDGVPQELTHMGQNGKVQFINNQKESAFAKLPSLIPIIIALLIIYLVLFIAAAIAWRWPLHRDIKADNVKKPDPSIYGGLTRLQPGIKGIRILLVVLLLLAVALAIMQWGCPWAASNIPILRQMSNYVAVTS
ncbi:class E sortase [Bifidobacterium sp. ESL0728]|uniref:class E sortase n=1 Tax=Bifidobacterium sp. ESL0728 TaxID=2983220 RepID=UPI0023F7B1F9|nr:class E sortase [Bifidobacterium sp. ESL0728]WEV60028.1 class E sortase [Bifidobacterium sp. ESL0728]